ncbi:unnamed protein product [Lampetra planeri]
MSSSDPALLRAVRAKAKTMNLSSKKMRRLPGAIGQLPWLERLCVKSNALSELPAEMHCLTRLTELNLGNNELQEVPEILRHLTSLQKLHLFNNRIKRFSDNVLEGLHNLVMLNINNNQLKTLPRNINNLTKLQKLSANGNLLESVPEELCGLARLKELHLANNRLTALPAELGHLNNLERLHLQHNEIRELPESLGSLQKLEVVDVAANELWVFPSSLHRLPLKELYCEENPLVRFSPVESVQEDEVMSLKELVARFILHEMKTFSSPLQLAVAEHPPTQETLTQARICAVCGESFLNIWLECVQFLNAKNDLKLISSITVIPVRVLLCSYKCFNQPGHAFYGMAFT